MKLLLAEDERELSDALTVILTHSNYLVDAVYTGTEALDYLQVEHYDGVILDVMMPGMDGFEVLKAVRAAGNTVPVLMLTARSDVDDRVTGLDLGADDYLTKPFATKELLARVRAITRRVTRCFQFAAHTRERHIGLCFLRADVRRTDTSPESQGISIVTAVYELSKPNLFCRTSDAENMGLRE